MKNLLFKVNIAIILAFTPLLIWYYQIDGILINQAVTYRPTVDPMALKLTKKDWRRGEEVVYQTSFCKTRTANAKINWNLANDTLTFFPEREYRNIPVGCYPKDPSKLSLGQTPKIPEFATNGCSHYFTAAIERDIGGGRIITTNLRTEEFCVVD